MWIAFYVTTVIILVLSFAVYPCLRRRQRKKAEEEAEALNEEEKATVVAYDAARDSVVDPIVETEVYFIFLPSCRPDREFMMISLRAY